MSGGYFDYDQYKIGYIADKIQDILDKQGKKGDKDLCHDPGYYERYPEEMYHPTYPKKIQQKFRKAITALHRAEIYAHRIDWYLSGDDGDDNFLERLTEELNKLK